MLSRLDHHGWNAIRLATPQLELIAPLDVGPRLVVLRRPGGTNLFAEIEGQRGGRGEPELCLRGGHRLWHAPEDVSRTYQPDNTPPALRELAGGRGFELVQDTEPATGMQKALRVELLDDQSLRITHTLTNRGLWPVETAAWALTMLRTGGYSVIPLPSKGAHAENLLPRFSLVQWAYTDLAQPGWRLFPGFLSIDTRRIRTPQKIGLTDYPGWSAYWIAGELFVKAVRLLPGAVYPDAGCPFETFADRRFTELETLSPLRLLAPGRRITHVETWGLLANVSRPASEAVFRRQIRPAVEAWLGSLAGNGRGNGRLRAAGRQTRSHRPAWTGTEHGQGAFRAALRR